MRLVRAAQTWEWRLVERGRPPYILTLSMWVEDCVGLGDSQFGGLAYRTLATSGTKSAGSMRGGASGDRGIT
jgi:hypothetical protein